jgi:hypothetical protein
MAARLLLLACAAALITFGAARTSTHRACDDGRREAFQIGAKKRPATDAAGVGRRMVEHCRGSGQLVDGASAFLRAGAIAPAGYIAAAAVRREPQRRDSWLAVAGVRRARGDQAGAQRALARARQLDPLSFRGR